MSFNDVYQSPVEGLVNSPHQHLANIGIDAVEALRVAKHGTAFQLEVAINKFNAAAKALRWDYRRDADLTDAIAVINALEVPSPESHGSDYRSGLNGEDPTSVYSYRNR